MEEIIQNKSLKTLILNGCFIEFNVIELILKQFPNLSELYLDRNNYSSFQTSSGFLNESVKMLFVKNNGINDWNEVAKLGRCFPSLESLILSDNLLSDFQLCDQNSCLKTLFPKLESLVINNLNIKDWSIFEKLSEFPCLKSIRAQGLPIYEHLSDDQRFFMVLSYLPDSIQNLNGSLIKKKDKEQSQRKFLRFYMDKTEKPKRYFDLENIHGKLEKLAEVNLKTSNITQVLVKFEQKQTMVKVNLNSTIAVFKKSLEEFVGHKSSMFRIFYIDFEMKGSYDEKEECRLMNRTLKSYRVKDGDEFAIDLKI